jgi:CubicO group peptidase (beta-lactamase class C family)
MALAEVGRVSQVEATTPLMHRHATALLLQLVVTVAAGGQSPGGLDSIDTYIGAELARYHIPGASVAVLRGDSVVLARGYGYANLELRVPASDSTVYQSGSVGKQFTAAAVVMLAEQGRLSLDDPITRYLPEGPDGWRRITIRHLLTHTSGIGDYTDSTLDVRRDYTEADMVRLAARQALEFAPGERWSYSNTGYVLLGIIIHRVTGVFYGDFLQEHIFRPLGMRTRIISEADIVPNRAAGYRLVGDTLKNQEWVSPSLNTTADGALYFTVRDLAQWAVALNHWRIPSRTGLEATWTPVRLNSGGTYPYGFGWQITQQRGFRRTGHSGSWQGFQTTIQRYPDFDLTVIVLDNLAESLPETMAMSIAGIIEPRLVPPHFWQASPSGIKPPEAIDQLLRDVAAGAASAPVAPGLKAFVTADVRGRIARRLKNATTWALVGCDGVEERGIARLGTSIARICYAKGLGPAPNSLVTVLYGADWRAAGIEFYSF